MIEQLEPRRLFAGVTFHKGILTIIGTDSPDMVSLTKKREFESTTDGNVFFIDHLIVKLNGDDQGDFRFPDIHKVVIKLRGGDDTLIVGNKNLHFDIDGGDGDDTIVGGPGSDTLRGGAGRNVLSGGMGNDRLICVSGYDVLSGGGGSDTADFSAFTTPLHITLDGVADDAVPGRTGNVKPDIETVIGGGGADYISAATLDSVVNLQGNGGNDTLIGSAMGDTLHGGPGNDSLRGGEGNDYLNGDGGRDKIFGEKGNDTIMGSGPDPVSIPLPNMLPTDPSVAGAYSDGCVDTLNGGVGDDVAFVDSFDITSSIETSM